MLSYPLSDEEAHQLNVPERNDLVDTVLAALYGHTGNRDVIISSADEDLCKMVSDKHKRDTSFDMFCSVL